MSRVNMKEMVKNFNWCCYLKMNPDLEKAGITTQEKATRHYFCFGKKEGRLVEPTATLAEQVAEVVAEPVAEVVAEPVAEVVAEPVVEVVAEPVVEVVAEPVAEPTATLVEPVAEVVVESEDVIEREVVSEQEDPEESEEPVSPEPVELTIGESVKVKKNRKYSKIQK